MTENEEKTIFFPSSISGARTINVTAAAAAKSPQTCPTLCDPIDGSPSGSPVRGIFQARVLEWGAWCLIRHIFLHGKKKHLTLLHPLLLLDAVGPQGEADCAAQRTE